MPAFLLDQLLSVHRQSDVSVMAHSFGIFDPADVHDPKAVFQRECCQIRAVRAHPAHTGSRQPQET